jgi:hypothetical protein
MRTMIVTRETVIDYTDPIGAVEQLTRAARSDEALAFLGDPLTRQAFALIHAGELRPNSTDRRWVGEVALELLREGRDDDAAVWARVGSLLDEAAPTRHL